MGRRKPFEKFTYVSGKKFREFLVQNLESLSSLNQNSSTEPINNSKHFKTAHNKLKTQTSFLIALIVTTFKRMKHFTTKLQNQ